MRASERVGESEITFAVAAIFIDRDYAWLALDCMTRFLLKKLFNHATPKVTYANRSIYFFNFLFSSRWLYYVHHRIVCMCFVVFLFFSSVFFSLLLHCSRCGRWKWTTVFCFICVQSNTLFIQIERAKNNGNKTLFICIHFQSVNVYINSRSTATDSVKIYFYYLNWYARKSLCSFMVNKYMIFCVNVIASKDTRHSETNFIVPWMVACKRCDWIWNGSDGCR